MVDYLVSEGNKDGKQEEVRPEGERLLYVSLRQGHKAPQKVDKSRYGDEEIITVGFDEVVASDGRWVYVVFPKGPQEMLKHKIKFNIRLSNSRLTFSSSNIIQHLKN